MSDDGDIRLHRFNLGEYHRLIEAGGFDEDMEVELIDGFIVKRGEAVADRQEGRSSPPAALISGVAMDLAAEELPITLDYVHRFSLDEYHRLIESGALDEDTRVELIEGFIVDMSPKTREHELAADWLVDWLALNRDRERYRLRAAGALTLERSEPEPDFAVIPRDAPAPYHPRTAALVVEVSVTSLWRDAGVKSTMYAKAGVPEYWIVNLRGRRVICHRDPRPDGSYRDVTEVTEGEQLVATSVKLPPLDVRELMAAAYA